jgi:hypothetical protein
MWCVPKVDAEYVARMEDVPDLYASAPVRAGPVRCGPVRTTTTG